MTVNQINTANDEKWLAVAIAEAKKAEKLAEVPVGAVLINQAGELLASAHNRPISTHDASAHAEIEVLRQAGRYCQNYRLPNTTLYVTLEPCPMCTGAIIHARISRVVFAAQDFRSGACGTVFSLHDSPLLNHKFAVTFIENPDYIKQLRDFFRQRR